MGADGRMYEAQRAAFPSLVVPEWLSPASGESLVDYAERFASDRTWPERFVLGGASFGGMVAYEMARHLKPDAVVLIGSCTRRQSVALHLRAAAPFASLFPTSFFAPNRIIAPVMAQKFGAGTPEQAELLTTMLADADPAFIKWACTAVAGWKSGEEPSVPVHQVHGGDDKLIPASSVDAELVVPGGGHLVNVTHAEQVNAFLSGLLANLVQ